MSMTNPAPVLSIRNLSLQAKGAPQGQLVVESVSFDILPGETVCVVGESGSGKSVSAYAVMGLLPPDELVATSGEILLEQENILSASSERLRQLRATRMSMVFQEPMTALNPVETIGQQIEEVLALHTPLDTSERRKRVLDMLAQVHMPNPEQIYKAYPHQLSGGQRQRVVICLALILRPKLLIADEPTTALDVTTQKQILTLIKELQHDLQAAVLFITHDFGVVSEIADRIVVMKRGHIVEVGTCTQILAAPAEAYTRMLVSSVPSLVPQHKPPVEGSPRLTVHNLSKRYIERHFWGGKKREVVAAESINLALRPNEILGVVGESGSGKSTVARCIARLIEPTSGQITIDGNNVAHAQRGSLHRLRKKLQIVFQDPYRSLNPRMKIGESIAEGLMNYGVDRASGMKRAAELLTLVGLDPSVLHRYPHQFSGGQRQRICIARALALEPDVLIADESVSALDVSVQAQVLALLEEIRERTGVAILFITHDLRVAAQICDSIIVMQRGRIVESGRASDVLTHPQSDYTRQLIAAAPGRRWDFQHFCPLADADA